MPQLTPHSLLAKLSEKLKLGQKQCFGSEFLKKVKGTAWSSDVFELGEKPKETGNSSLGANLQNAEHSPLVSTALSFGRLCFRWE